MFWNEANCVSLVQSFSHSVNVLASHRETEWLGNNEPAEAKRQVKDFSRKRSGHGKSR